MLTRLKVSTACNNCRRRKAKCNGQLPRCGPCSERNEADCVYSRNQQQRKAKTEAPQPLPMQDGVAYELSPKRPYSEMSSLAGSDRRIMPEPYGTNQIHATVLSEQTDQTVENIDSSIHPIPTCKSTPDDAGLQDANAMTGFVGDPSMTVEYFGTSSASSFMRQINSAIDIRLGRSQAGMDSVYSTPGSRSNQAGAGPHYRLNDQQNYVLPARRFADGLLQAYYDLVWAVLPIHDRTVFQEAYENAWLGAPTRIPERTLFCMMNLTFALGSQFSEVVDPGQRKATGQSFWARASKLFGSPGQEDPSIERVQCMLLMGLYLQSTRETYECWMMVGSAIRMAQSLGLHLRTGTEERPRCREDEIARRAWHGCVYLDRVLSMTFGRPSMIARGLTTPVPLPIMIDDDYLDTQDEPSPVRPDGRTVTIAFFIKSLQLYDIINDILFELYLQAGDTKIEVVTQLTSVLELDHRLVQWVQSLPDHLQYTSDDHNEGLVCRRQRVVLRARYLYARICALRPILAEFYLKQMKGVTTSLPRTLSRPLINECAALCFESAHEMIDVLYSNFNFKTVTGPIPAWWAGVLFIYTSATVLLAERLRPAHTSVYPPRPCSGDSWDRAIQLLKAYSRVGEPAQRCVAALGILSTKIQSASQHLSSDGLVEEEQLVEPPNEAPGVDPNCLGAVDEINRPFDLGEFDFDIDNMFWLNVPPTDTIF